MATWAVSPSKKKKKKAEEEERSKKSPPFGLTVHAKVFALAEMHCVAGLKELAVEKFRAEARTHWEAENFLRAAEMAYLDTVEDIRELRTAVVDVCQSHPDLLMREDCKDLLKRVPELTYDMLLHAHGMNQPGGKKRTGFDTNGDIVW